MRLRCAFCISWVTLFASSVAWGQAATAASDPAESCAPTLATRGRSIVSGERIIGIQYWEYEHREALDLHAFHVAWGRVSPLNPYNLPSVAYDYVVSDGATIGGSAGFVTGNRQGSAWLSTLRGGYMFALSENVWAWWRVGVGYFATYAAGSSAERVTGLFFTAAPQVVFGIGPHFALTMGVTADIGIWGHHRRNPSAIFFVNDSKWSAIALTMGLLVHF